MSDFKRTSTSAEVYAVLRARHGDAMTVFASFSDPDGTFVGGDGTRGRMETVWALMDAPLLEVRTTWDIDPAKPSTRINSKNEYWLCAATDEDKS
jgi:hypothetical protein